MFFVVCFSGVIGLVVKNNKVVVKGIIINSKCFLLKDDKGKLIISVLFDIKLEGVDERIVEKVIVDVNNICFYSNVIRGNIDFKYNVL